MATVEELVNSLYEMVQDAGAVPFTDKCMLERDRVLDMLDELRVSLPSDIKMAQDIVEKRNELIAAGKREADALRKQAEEAARTMVNETEIVKAARMKAKEIMVNAETQSRELQKAANMYCEDTLKRTEESVALGLEEVKKARARFRDLASKNQ
ncbi:MAG: hypothetical protein KH319_06610 [Butyricicoccus pullicaecorum]|jgi:hypothetical protein|nr:hypothetical protein [Butyricicoccus pullicaecorum]